MNKKDVVELFRIVNDFYPNRVEVTKQMIEVWHEQLKDSPKEKVLKRLYQHSKESRFPPTLADVYVEQVKYLGDASLYHDDEELLREMEELEDAIRKAERNRK